MTEPVVTAISAALIAALRDSGRYPHPVAHLNVLETHISWVILTGSYAYKIKKPVNLGFLDFSTLEARRKYCEEELRLNRRLAPSIYESVVTITGTPDHPLIGGHGPVIEYAVRMREFTQNALASRLLADGAIRTAHIEAVAALVASFHAATGVAAHGSRYGTPESVIQPARDNFTQLAVLLPDKSDQSLLARLAHWTEREFNERRTLIEERQKEGRVRECHGDLHLGNIVMLEDALTPFDCIEFDAGLRWIDVMSEVAFLVMDLTDRGRADYASHFLNAYLEACGDYSGTEVLRFYRVYRAMVRAKVHALRARQGGLSPADELRLLAAARGYIDLAQRCAGDGRAALVLMHGLSGSGKSVLAQSLADNLAAIRLRSDVERKRLQGLAPLARSGSVLSAGLYTADLTRATYQRLLDLARVCVNAGNPVIVDATFLHRWQRELFRREASLRKIPFKILDVIAPEATLRARVAARQAANSDASEAGPEVLSHQLAHREALDLEESSSALRIDASGDCPEQVQHTTLKALCVWLGAQTSPEPKDASN